MRKRVSPISFTISVAAIDIVLLCLGLFLGVAVWDRSFGFLHSELSAIARTPLSLLVVVSLVGFFYLFDLYQGWLRVALVDVMFQCGFALLFIVGIEAAVVFLTKYFAEYRSSFPLWAVLQAVLLFASRAAIWKAYSTYSSGRKLLIAASSKQSAEHLLREAVASGPSWYTEYEWVLGSDIAEIEYQIRSADSVLIGPGVQCREQIVRLCALHRCESVVIPEPIDLLTSHSTACQIGDYLTLTIRPVSLTAFQQAFKRAFDVVFAGTMLVAVLPVVVVVAVAIRLTSKGPIFFSQERVGKDSKPYRMLKFRTMIENAEAKTGPVLASEQDPRITPLGKFLRSSRLDELPQLFNVLLGQMSMVGPRPERDFFTREFERQEPTYAMRTVVKPGITGLAQVLGRYATTPIDKLRFDLYYISNYSFLLDLKIICRTLVVVFRRRQADGLAEQENAALRNFVKRSTQCSDARRPVMIE